MNAGGPKKPGPPVMHPLAMRGKKLTIQKGEKKWRDFKRLKDRE